MMRLKIFFVLLLVMASSVLFTGCRSTRTTSAKTASTPKPARIGWKQQGVASWYGEPYDGRRAANGEIYNMDAFTAAHKTLPFETWVRVKNLSNKKTTEVRITDRGPFVGGRIIDLSRAAARQVDLVSPGTARVKLEVIRRPKNLPSAPVIEEMFAVQIAAVGDEQIARKIAADAARFGQARVRLKLGSDPVIYRVLVGRESSQQANEHLGAIRAAYRDAFVVRTD